jgi:glycosyltransferase involved in cell wall biosynthesis
MGGSALRAMAIGKPVLIVGEQNFSGAFTPESAEEFFYNGIFGVGDGRSDNTRLVSEIQSLINGRDRLLAIGKFSREFVVTRYSLEAGSARLAALCQEAIYARPRLRVSVADGFRTAAVLGAGTMRHALQWPPRLPPRRTAQV